MLKIDLIVCKLNGTALIQFLPLLQYQPHCHIIPVQILCPFRRVL